MRLRVAILVIVLVAALVLYGVATAAGSRQGSGGGDALQQGPVSLLGKVLVRPASASDLVGTGPCAVHGKQVSVPAGGSCLYRLRTQFLGLRLTLSTVGTGEVTAELVQPDPKSDDTATIGPGQRADLTYKETGSSLTLSCQSPKAPTCEVRVG